MPLSPPITPGSTQGFPWFESHGHSYVTGVVTIGNQDLYSNKLARTLDADLIFRGANGVTLSKTGATPSGETVDYGSVWWLLRNFTAGNAQPYIARGGIVGVFLGLNDLNLVGGPAAWPISSMKKLLRTYINYYRICALWDDSNAIFTRGTQWTTQAGTDRNFGAGYTMSTVSTLPTGNITIAIPSTFSGGTLVIFGIGQDTNAGPAGITFDVIVDSVTHGQFDCAGADQTGAAGNRLVQNCYRIPNLAAGSKTIVLDPVTLQGSSAFDGGMIDGIGVDDPNLSPHIIVFEQPRLPAGGYAAHGGGTARYGDSDVNTWNQYQAEVCQEFPASEVIYVPLPLMHGDASYFHTDLLHPNVKGHSYIADQAKLTMEAAQIRTKHRQLYPTEGLRIGQGIIASAAGSTTANFKLPAYDHRDVLRGYVKLFTT